MDNSMAAQKYSIIGTRLNQINNPPCEPGMQLLSSTRFTVPLALVLAFFSLTAQQTSPDLILFNGRVFTSNVTQLYVEALAIRGERILAAGTSKEILTLAGKGTRQIDLGGRTVIPGINDANVHLTVGPKAYELPIKSMDPRWNEITEALASAVRTNPKTPGSLPR